MPACRHPDIQKFDGLRCCLSCGEAIFDDFPQTQQVLDDENTLNYQYKPLNYELGQEIRLAVLHPGREPDDITCDIVHVNLLDNPAYEAVSYTWATMNGDASLSEQISCRGGTIAVTKNCKSLLLSLRRFGLNRTIWIDAVCINQSNTLERNHQVKLMATIYSNASQVLAYIGSQYEDTSPSITKVIEYLEGTSDGLLGRQVDVPNYYDVATFLRTPYFDRVWVLQEIALAKIVTLVVGTTSTRWTAATVSTLLSLCSNLGIQPPSALRWLPASRPDSDDLLDALHRSRNCSATDMRDKVYALLGLVKQEIADAIAVDYSRSPSEVYTDVAIYLLKVQGRIDVLLHAVTTRETGDNIASWVPQWNSKSDYEPLPSQFSSSQVQTLAASWFSSPTAKQVLDCTEEKWETQRALYAHTDFSLDICDPTTISTGSRIPSPPCLRIRAHLLDTIKKRLPIASIPKPLILPRELPDAFGNVHPCSACLTGNGKDLNISNPAFTQRMQDQRTAFMEMMRSSTKAKTPFVTQSSMGFAHTWPNGQEVLVGDSIWALAGLGVPMILRKNGDHYVLVGECYLFRATLPHLCMYCGDEDRPWPMVTGVIDIW